MSKCLSAERHGNTVSLVLVHWKKAVALLIRVTLNLYKIWYYLIEVPEIYMQECDKPKWITGNCQAVYLYMKPNVKFLQVILRWLSHWDGSLHHKYHPLSPLTQPQTSSLVLEGRRGHWREPRQQRAERGAEQMTEGSQALLRKRFPWQGQSPERRPVCEIRAHAFYPSWGPGEVLKAFRQGGIGKDAHRNRFSAHWSTDEWWGGSQSFRWD